MIHTLPALVALRRHYPQAHISWLVEETAAEVLRGHAALDEIVVWRRREFQRDLRRLKWVKAAGVFRGVLKKVRGRNFDLVIDFQALLKSALWVWFTKGQRKVGFGPGLDHSEASYLVLNERIPAVSMDVHALERGLILLEKLGVPRGPVEYRFPHDPDAESLVEGFLSGAGVVGASPMVVIHPMARWPTKLWYTDRFAALADALHERGIQPVFTGGIADRACLDEIERQMRSSCLRFDGKGGLPHFAALCRRAQVVVSTDTGPMHLAAAVGTKVVALFGPTAPNRTGPYGSGHAVIRVGVDCSPCFKRNCDTTLVEHRGCMNRITVEQVLEVVMRCLKECRSHGDPHPIAEPVSEAPDADS